jgi:hypothetical protein
MLLGDYKDVAMFDTYTLSSFTLKIQTDCDAVIESNIHIKDIGNINEEATTNALNEWGYRFIMLQKIAAHSNITTSQIEHLAIAILGSLPPMPKFGTSK